MLHNLTTYEQKNGSKINMVLQKDTEKEQAKDDGEEEIMRKGGLEN